MQVSKFQQGFSLLQLSIILAIVSVVGVTLLPLDEGGERNNRALKMTFSFNKLEEALVAFQAAYGRLPCPADATLAPTDANYGLEANDPGNCLGGTITSTFGPADITGANPLGNVVGGMIPTKSLQIPDNYALDSYGRRLTYVVDRRATEPVACSMIKNGDIVLKGADGEAKSNAMGLILSHQENGHGAFPGTGSTVDDRLNSGSIDIGEWDNASVDGTFTAQFDANFVKKEPSASFDDMTHTLTTCCRGAICSDAANHYQGAEIIYNSDSNIHSLKLNPATDTFTKTYSATIPNATTLGLALTKNNEYLLSRAAAGTRAFYRRFGSHFEKMNDFTAHPYATDMTSDGTHIFTEVANALKHYKRVGNTIVAMPDFNAADAELYGVEVSADDKYDAIIARKTAPSLALPYDGLHIFKRSGDTLTLLNSMLGEGPQPSGALTINPGFHGKLGIAFSPDGYYLAVAQTTSPFVKIFKRNGDAFEYIDPGTPVDTSSPQGLWLQAPHVVGKLRVIKAPPGAFAFSRNSRFLFIGQGDRPYFVGFSRLGDNFHGTPPAGGWIASSAPPADADDIGTGLLMAGFYIPEGGVLHISVSHDDQYVVVSHFKAPYISVWKNTGGTPLYTKLPDKNIGVLTDANFGRPVLFRN